MKDRPEQIDRPIVVGLKEQGLLEIIEPESAVDSSATEQLASAMTDIIASGTLDELSKEQTAFHEISMSRLGSLGDRGLYEMIFEELKKRGIAKDSADGVSIPLHPKNKIARSCSALTDSPSIWHSARLSPATDLGSMVEALSEFLSQGVEPSCGSVVAFDLNAVTVDLASVPIDEVLGFRRQSLEAHKCYMLSVRKFAMALSRMSEEERRVNFEDRQGDLEDLASDLQSRGRKAWKKPASFAFSGLGAALSATAAPVSSLI